MLASEWGKVIAQVSDLVTKEKGDKGESDVGPFAVFLSHEMKKLNPDQQDEFKFNVMDVLRNISDEVNLKHLFL